MCARESPRCGWTASCCRTGGSRCWTTDGGARSTSRWGEDMSRAFTNEDASGEALPEHRYPLPDRDDPQFPLAAARALIAGANLGDSSGAEEATGFMFGAPELVPAVRIILEDA